MFKVVFTKQIHSGFSATQTGDVWLEYETRLDFPPSPDFFYNLTEGIEVESDQWIRDTNGSGTRYNSPNDFNQVYWDDIKKQFTFYLPADKEIYNAELDKETHRPLEDIVKEYTDLGWKVR